jgi:hypothetical protein
LRPLGRKTPCGKGVGFGLSWSCSDILVLYTVYLGIYRGLVWSGGDGGGDDGVGARSGCLT